MDASSTLVPSLQALHKDALKKELTASSRFTVAKAMTSCEPRTPFVGRGRPPEWPRSGWVKGAERKDENAHFQTREGISVKDRDATDAGEVRAESERGNRHGLVALALHQACDGADRLVNRQDTMSQTDGVTMTTVNKVGRPSEIHQIKTKNIRKRSLDTPWCLQ